MCGCEPSGLVDVPPILYTWGRGKILVLYVPCHDISSGAALARWISPCPSLTMLVSLLALAASLLLAPPDTTAPATADDSVAAPSRVVPPPLAARMNSLGLWIGGSPFSTALIAKMKGAQFGLIGIEFGHVLATENHMAVRYTADLIPAAVLAYPAPPRPDGESADAIAPSPSPTVGMGVAPVGLQFVYRTHRRAQPFFGGSGGLMAFPAPIPDGRGRRLNYTFDISVGIRYVLTADRVLTIGYRFHHLSNGFRGDINPGFDANVFYLGLSTL